MPCGNDDGDEVEGEIGVGSGCDWSMELREARAVRKAHDLALQARHRVWTRGSKHQS